MTYLGKEHYEGHSIAMLQAVASDAVSGNWRCKNVRYDGKDVKIYLSKMFCHGWVSVTKTAGGELPVTYP